MVFPIEYVSGVYTLPSVSPGASRTRFSANVIVDVVNVGDTDEIVEVNARLASGPAFVSDRSPRATIGPGSRWDHSWVHQEGGDRVWFLIRATSKTLVPSIEFTMSEQTDQVSHWHVPFARCAPGDFAVFHRLDAGPLAPEEGPLLEDP
jgi:hypothetical protein